jgi:hypothetical protein
MIVHSYIRAKGGCGLGDFLRGSISIHQAYHEQGIPIAVTFKDHPISEFIVPNDARIPDDLQIHDLNNKADTPFTLKNQIGSLTGNTLSSHNHVGVYCNTWPQFPISNVTKEFMVNSFKPNDVLSAAIQDAKPKEDYEVIHIRLGDIVAYNTTINFTIAYDYDKIIEKIICDVNKIKSQSQNKFIIMCDSDKVKELLSTTCGLTPTAAKSVHLNIAKDCDGERIKDTLVDFFMLTHAKAIHQFSVHHWGSSFSNCANWIYNTPLNQYKLLK